MVLTQCPNCDSRNYNAELLTNSHDVPELQDTRFSCNDCGHTEICPAT